MDPLIPNIKPEEIQGCDMELAAQGDTFIMRFSRKMDLLVLSKQEVYQVMNAMKLFLETR